MAASDDYRIETDSMGEVQVPAGAYYGAQTQRAVENFPVSDLRFGRSFIAALGMIKSEAAVVNRELGLLDEKISDAIRQAAEEVVEGRLDDDFVVDIFQTGSGTSTNMNSNEVIANRAIEILGGEIGSKTPVHPNDHVNTCQSSNDVIPTAIHIAALTEIEERLIPALERFKEALDAKAKAFDDVVKTGRTHLQDAIPVRLGQEFSGYASQVEHAIQAIRNSETHLSELALGGTAVGTGLNAHPEFASRVIQRISERTGLNLREAPNHFEAQSAQDALVETSGAVKTAACSLMKIANDIRWMGCGPRNGFGELLLPEVQPGSSIMPGKINPVLAESLCQVVAHVIGNDLSVTIGTQLGNFELIVMMPMMAHNLLESIAILANGANAFNEKCLAGLEANRKRCEEMIEGSLALCTSLAPVIGYDAAAKVAKEAAQAGKTVREVATAQNVLPPEELEKALDPHAMTVGGFLKK